jgi:hypothetical protein
MVDDALDHVKSTLNGTVQQGHRVALFSGLFKPFKDRPKRTHGGAVIKQGLSEGFFGQAGPQHTRFVDVTQGSFVRFCQGVGLVGQMGHLRLALTTLDTKVTEFSEDTAALLKQFTQFAFQMAATDFVLPSTLEFIVGPPTGGLDFGFHGHQFGLGRTDRVLGHRKIAHGRGLTFMRSTRLILKHAEMTLIGLQASPNLGQTLGIGLQICTERGFFLSHALNGSSQLTTRRRIGQGTSEFPRP